MRSRPEIGSTPLIWALLLVSVSIIAGSSADSAIGALRQTAYADTLSDVTSRFDPVLEFRSNNHSEPVIPLPNMSAGLMSVPVDWRAAFRALNLRAARLRQDWLSGEFVAAAAAIPDRELKAMRAEAMAHLATSQRKGMFAPASGRSVPYSHILDHMPVMSAFYRDPLFISTLEQISGRKLLLSHETDPHAMTVYYYNRPGDFTGWHYDTSFYHGERLTVLVPLIDNSSCRLQVELHSRENEGLAAEQHEGRAKDDQTSWFGQFGVLVGQARSQQQQTKQGAQEVTPFDEMVCRSKRTTPGEVLFFNGDQVRHRVTPMGGRKEGDELRIMLSLEYVTTQEANPFWWAIYMLGQWGGYFGFPWYVYALVYVVPLSIVRVVVGAERRLRGSAEDNFTVGAVALIAVTLGYGYFMKLAGVSFW